MLSDVRISVNTFFLCNNCTFIVWLVSCTQDQDLNDKFQPKHKKKGRSSSGKRHMRKKGVEEEERKVCDVVWFSCLQTVGVWLGYVWVTMESDTSVTVMESDASVTVMEGDTSVTAMESDTDVTVMESDTSITVMASDTDGEWH